MQNFLLTSKKICPPQKNKIKNQQQKKSQQNQQKQPTKLKTPLQNAEVVQMVQ